MRSSVDLDVPGPAGENAAQFATAIPSSVDIRNTRTIRGVLKDGRWVHRTD